jgi:hypothetical protein
MENFGAKQRGRENTCVEVGAMTKMWRPSKQSHENKTFCCRSDIDGDCPFRLHLRKHSVAANSCSGNSLYRTGSRDGRHELAT